MFKQPSLFQTDVVSLVMERNTHLDRKAFKAGMNLANHNRRVGLQRVGHKGRTFDVRSTSNA